MAKKAAPKYSKGKLKLFIFFLIVASVFWVLTKFSREFTASVAAKISYTNLPETAALASNNLHEITFDLTANGFEILFYKLKKPALEINVTSYYDEDDDKFIISRNELVRKLSSNFNKYMDIKNLSVDGLTVNLDPIILKRIGVNPKIDISFKDGFKPIDSIQMKPDSITISGPKGVLEEIHSIDTKRLTLNNVERSISETLELISPSDDIVKIKPSKIKVEWPVAEFSQGEFTLPVEVINLPPSLELKLVPERITVSFDIAIDEFQGATKENFRVVCDYSKRNESDNFMLPVLVKKPKGAVNIVFEPKKIDFFIFK